MRARELSRWMKQLGALTPHQRDQLFNGLQALTATDAVAEVLRQRESPSACPIPSWKMTTWKSLCSKNDRTDGA